MIASILSFLFIVTVLVAIHEAGHYLAAKYYSVGVKEFSIGFGKVLLWSKRYGTTFNIRMLPLGGYILLNDRRAEQFLKPKNADQSDRQKAREIVDTTVEGAYIQDISRFRQIVIYLAGPLANFAAAFLIFVVLGLTGGLAVKPIITYVDETKQAYANGIRSGDTIVNVNNEAIYSMRMWHDYMAGSNEGTYRISVVASDDIEDQASTAVLYTDDTNEEQHLTEDLLGFSTSNAFLPPIIREVVENSAAQEANLFNGDEIISVDGVTVNTAKQWADSVRANPNNPLDLTVKRQDGSVFSTVMIPHEIKDASGVSIGRAGTYLSNSATFATLPFSVSIYSSIAILLDSFVKTVEVLRGLVVGNGNSENIVGMVGIAQQSGQAVENGWHATFIFMAFLSFSLGFFNLLPLPVLDGGQILRLCLEAIIQKPFGIKALIAYQTVGIVAVFGILIMTLFLDISRLN